MPVSAILLGAIFLGEHLELFEIVGMVLIAIGLVTIDGRPAAAAAGDRRLIATRTAHRQTFFTARAGIFRFVINA